MTESSFRIRIRDSGLIYRGQLSSYIEASFIPRWNGIGTWSIKMAADAPGAELFTPGCGILVALPDGTQFSGHMTDVVDEWGADNGGNGTLTCNGVEDKAILGYRVVLPTPSADYTAQTAVANYVQSGMSETLIKKVVRDNLGDTALVARRLPGLYVPPDSGLGLATSISARYDNLLDLVQRLASPVNLGFSLISAQNGGWTFQVAQAINSADAFKFSRNNGNMTAYSFGRTRPTITRAVVAGSGAGAARNIRVYDQPAGAVDPSWGWLNENFLDRRDTNLSTDMAQAASEAFASGAEQVSLSASVINTEAVRIGRDYGLGSIVTVEVRGVEYTDTITEINYSSKAGELRMTPSIGGGDSVYGKALDIYRVVRSIGARVAGLERRF